MRRISYLRNLHELIIEYKAGTSYLCRRKQKKSITMKIKSVCLYLLFLFISLPVVAEW